MQSYADTGFVFSLYVDDDKHSAAVAAMSSLPLPLTPLTPLHRVELCNAVARWAFQGKVSKLEATAIWETIQADTRIFSRDFDFEWPEVMQEAERLSAVHTVTCGARSLDVIHVATALKLGARDFISFDKRQRELAALAGLNVLPAAS